MTDKELFDRIVAGAPANDSSGSGHVSFVADRAEMALRTVNQMGHHSRAQALTHLGKYFRVALPATLDSDSDIQVLSPPLPLLLCW